MKRIEIIKIRMAQGNHKSIEFLSHQINESVKAAGEHLEVVAVYRRNGLETDLAVHIYSHREPDAAGQSDLGLRLASALRVHGLVEHTVWEEIK